MKVNVIFASKVKEKHFRVNWVSKCVFWGEVVCNEPARRTEQVAQRTGSAWCTGSFHPVLFWTGAVHRKRVAQWAFGMAHTFQSSKLLETSPNCSFLAWICQVHLSSWCCIKFYDKRWWFRGDKGSNKNSNPLSINTSKLATRVSELTVLPPKLFLLPIVPLSSPIYNSLSPKFIIPFSYMLYPKSSNLTPQNLYNNPKP